MRFVLYGVLVILTLIGIYHSTYFVAHGEVDFHADIARDFLLLDELSHKKIVFIGPRSSNSGLFHGPLWTYINYPAYVLGNGNPVVVAWFWIVLEIVFLITSFFIAKKLFGMLPALFYIAILSARLVPHMNRVFHAEAAFFIVPLYFFTIVQYIQNRKKGYLAMHFLSGAILTELNIGVGIQMLLLSGLITFAFISKNKLYKHLFLFILILLFLSNFIIFDLRHQFIMSRAIISTGNTSGLFLPLAYWLQNRIDNFMPLQLVVGTYGIFNYLHPVLFLLIITITVLQLKKKNKQRHVYFLLLYFYFGYILLSYFNKGIVLYHHIHFLIPLTTLWLVSFLSGRYKLLFLPFIVLALYFNFNAGTSYIDQKKNEIGKDFNSWKALSAVAKEVVAEENGKEFGYFVFAPDAFAYQPRYAMIYHFRVSGAKAFEYVKKPTTYIIASPPPPNDPYMNHIWWRKNPVRITSEPKEVKKFPGGFTIEKFVLSKEEQNIPHDKNIEIGIHFR